MSVRFRLALTVFLAGLAAALGVITSVALAFQRFEHESNYQRADTFLSRVVAMHGDLLDQHERNPEELLGFLRSLVLYDPGSRLYLLDAQGQVLSSTSASTSPLTPPLTPQRVAMAPVREAAQAAALGDTRRAAYVMGDDPDQPGQDRVVAARPLGRTRIGPADAMAGYLYLVCSQGLPGPRLALFGSSLVGPALGSVLAVLALTTALAAWVIVTVTRPLQVLSTEVARAAELGFSASAPMHSTAPAQPTKPAKPLRDDEFGRLQHGFHALLARLREQWDQLRQLDGFRRESVSNLSHDLRSPLTATVACLETLESRWLTQAGHTEDLHLVRVALRNTRNAAGMVRSLGDLALLDEPQFQLHKTRLDLGEVLDDIALRFAGQAAQQGVTIQFKQQGSAAPVAEVDIELFERAVANLLDNALKFTPRGGHITLQAGLDEAHTQVTVAVQDSGAGIPAHDLPHLFDRLYQSRSSVAPATSEEGKGLGLAIVKRIAELHGGTVGVASRVGQGTTVSLLLPG
jgi:signal transduction histidine kinase